jgi:hypothetical protein
VFIINNDQNITFLGHTGPLIIVWALRPLNIVTIHYLKWGFKTWGVTILPVYTPGRKSVKYNTSLIWNARRKSEIQKKQLQGKYMNQEAKYRAKIIL